jgi:hypothetical protein
MWPISATQGLKRMRAFNHRQGKRSQDKIEGEDELELPPLKRQSVDDIWETSATIRTFRTRDPTTFSLPLVELFYKTLADVDVHL